MLVAVLVQVPRAALGMAGAKRFVAESRPALGADRDGFSH
jgi:hypothetical protein